MRHSEDWPECDMCGRPLLISPDDGSDFYCLHCDHCPVCDGIHECNPSCTLGGGETLVWD